MNISRISSNADMKSQQSNENISKKDRKNIYKISSNADIMSQQRSDNKVCIMTLNGHKVINNTIVHIISAESHSMSDNTTKITTYNIASEFSISIVSMQESFTTRSYIKSKNIIEENAHDISDHTLHIKNC